MSDQDPKLQKTDAEWRAELSPEQYHILREKGHVGFQSYNYRVEFRNVYLRPLDTAVAQQGNDDDHGRRLGLLGRLRHRFGR